ncbi:MAG: bifunctional YncE family protein/alkaline phosphatase family protein [Terriglobia bacterium]
MKSIGKTQRSAGTRVALADNPLNMVETPGEFLVSTNAADESPYLLSYNERGRKISGRLNLPSLWYGLDYDASRKLLLASAGTHSVFAVPFTRGVFGKPREIILKSCALTAGLAIDSGSTAVVACNQNHQVVRFDFESGKVLASAEVGEYPYTVRVLPGSRIAVSNWGQASVSILDGRNLKTLRTIPSGSHPTDMLALKASNQLLVACSDSDLISIIDLKSMRERRKVDLRLPGSKLGGAQPNAFTLDAAHHRLFVALAGINAVAVFQLDESGHDVHLKFQGLLPAGAYPTSVRYSNQDQSLFIADGRNAVLGPSSPYSEDYRRHPDHRRWRGDSGSRVDYVGYLLGGGIESISEARLSGMQPTMLTFAQQIYGAAPRKPSAQAQEMIKYFSARTNPNRPIRHVVYVIKENRTYDQVFGDMPQGNGEKDLTLFGESITPNEHALARQFVLYDNFYVDGDVSWNGHLWSMAAQSTDFVNKFWPATYSGHIRFDLWGSVYRGDAAHDQPVAVPSAGFLWDVAKRAGITYRDYGEWCNPDPEHPDQSRAFVRGLKGHYDPFYKWMIRGVKDQSRMDEWEREFRKMKSTGQMPALSIVYLPADHTVGTQPGYPVPRAMVADNDLAVGRLIDDLSHSTFWPSTAVFVLEDDAQDGPDHVDCHRSTLLVVSPYIRHGIVEHRQFSTVAVLKTIEQILGLDSLTYFDNRAPSLLVDFQKQPVLARFTHRPAEFPLDKMNTPRSPGAKQSTRWDFKDPDSAPEQALNRVIWQSVKGTNSEPPAPVYNVQMAATVRSQVR